MRNARLIGGALVADDVQKHVLNVNWGLGGLRFSIYVRLKAVNFKYTNLIFYWGTSLSENRLFSSELEHKTLTHNYRLEDP